jgi:hypothetical protein
MMRELSGGGSFVAFGMARSKSLQDNGRELGPCILYTVFRASESQRLSSTRVYPPSPLTPPLPSPPLRRARRIHSLNVSRKPMRVTRRPIWIAGVVLLAACFALLVVFRPPRPALLVVSSEPKIKVASVVGTFGTNHVYYYGGKTDRLLDSLIPRRRNRNAAWLRWHSAENSTVLWVRLVHPSYGVPRFRGAAVVPPPLFRAQMVDTNGVVTPLQALETFHQEFQSESLIMGWELAGQLKDHHGSTIRIDGTNGIGSVTLQVP